VFALSSLFAIVLLGATPAAEASPVEVWVGHEILRGLRHVPLHGDVPIETENYIVAKVQSVDGHLEMHQRYCRVEPKPVKGVMVAMSPTGVARMPVSAVTIAATPEGTATLTPWNVAWGRDDMDGDGKPGATFTVSGTFCSGDVYVASQSHYVAERAHLDQLGLWGELKVEQKQQILGASGLCLRAMAGDSSESQRGTFFFKRAASNTTCQSLAGKPWPVKAAVPAAPAKR
jgi:hypothetical protein